MSDDWMPPDKYFLRIVEPTVSDYWDGKLEHQKENAIFQLSSFSERFFKYHERKNNSDAIFGASTGKEFGAAIASECPEYGLLWDAANGVKHHFPDTRTRTNTISTATQVWDQTEYKIGDRWVSLDEAIATVYLFWKTLLSDDD